MIRVKTSQCEKDSHLYGWMEGKVTVVMERRGEASLQYSLIQQIEFPPHAVINPH